MQDVGKSGIPRASGARERGFKSRRPDFDCGGARVGTGGRLLSVTSQVRFLPPQLVMNQKGTEEVVETKLDKMENAFPTTFSVPLAPRVVTESEGQANRRWQPSRKRSSDEPWGFDSLTFRLKKSRVQSREQEVLSALDPQHSTFSHDRLAVGRLALKGGD